MTSRRGFLIGMLASGLAPSATWADLGAPAILSAGKNQTGTFELVGLSSDGQILFRHPLPGRGHAASAHPQRPEVVAFARRPGLFADVVDCRDGSMISRLTPPTGHHFYGHGCFSNDGRLLFTTENDYDTATGVIGVWDADRGYARLANLPSGGIGPHDMLLMPDGEGLVVANGGIKTHPDSGRAKLNLPTMRPNLSYLAPDGQLVQQIELPDDLHLNSIRHLSRGGDGSIAFAMQWQGDPGDDVPILGLHRPDGQIVLCGEDDPRTRNLNGYGGSVAFSHNGDQIALTSPRGGIVQLFDAATSQILREHRITDVCGIAATATGFIASDGDGTLTRLDHQSAHPLAHSNLKWDNHLIPIV